MAIDLQQVSRLCARYDRAVAEPGPADISDRLVTRYVRALDQVLEELPCAAAVAEALCRRLEGPGGRTYHAAAWLAAQLTQGSKA